MRILLVITSLGYGGAERVVTDLAKNLHQRGHLIQVISISNHIPLGTELEKFGINVRTLGFTGTIYSLKQIVRVVPQLGIMIREFEPSVIHSHIYLADIFARLAAPANIPPLVSIV